LFDLFFQVLSPSTKLLSAKVRAFVDLITSTCDWQFTEFWEMTCGLERGTVPGPI